MSSRINEIKARWAAATPGPWLTEKAFVYSLNDRGANRFFAGIQAAGTDCAPQSECESNAQAIAAAPDDIRWLVERVERLEKGLKEMANFVCMCHEMHPDQYSCSPCLMLKQILSEEAAHA